MDLFDLVAKITLDASDYEKGLENASKSAKDLDQSWSSAKKSITTGAKDIAVGTGALVGMGTAAFKAADNISKNLDEIDKTSQKVGLSTKAYQEWDYVLKISGTEMSAMTTGLKTLTNKFDDAVNGSDSAVKTFEKLGLSMEDISGLSREDLFSTVITAFQNMEDSAERAALANDLFGRSGQELAPLFNTTADETKDLIRQVNELGGVMSDTAVKNGAKFQDSLTSLKTAFAGASSTLLENLVPAITSLMDRVAEFISNGGLDNIIDKLQKIAPIVGAVVTAFAGFKIVTGIISIIQGVSTAFGVLQTALTGLVAANPIGLIIVAVTALAAVLVTLWNTNDEFREKVIATWNAVKDKAVEIFTAVKEFFENTFGAIKDFVTNSVETVKNEVSQKWSDIKTSVTDKVTEIRNTIQEKWTNIKNTISDTLNKIKSDTQTKLNNIKSAYETHGGGVKGIVAAGWTAIQSAYTSGYNILNKLTGGKLEEIRNLFSNAFNNLKNSALSWGRDLLQNFINGITEKISALRDKVSSIAQTVKDFIGFSEPKKGPLSNFHTYAPDMMMLFAEGISKSAHFVADAFDKVLNFDPNSDYNFSGTGTTASASRSITAGGGGIVINIDNMNVRDESDIRQIAKQLYNMINQSARSQGLGGVFA